nr:DUF1585 domain-containing protein [Kofleriaceae bacterium]
MLGLALAIAARDGRAERAKLTIADYRYFRALSIDLLGRPPTRDEVAAFEAPAFSIDAWLDARLAEPGYAERVRRIYTDLLRLDIGPSFQFVPNPVVLRRQEVLGPDGKPIGIYFRRGQRRADVATDGDFCFTQDETGQQFPVNAAPTGTAKPVTQALLDERTVVVKPWWLYADYHSMTPTDRYQPDWVKRFPGFTLAPPLLADGDVRVCREEAQTVDTGAVYASGRPAIKKGEQPPAGRLTQPPGDSGFARANKGRAVSCGTGVGFASSLECGCGIGLERCMPSPSFANEAAAFVMPVRTSPLGEELPFEAAPQPQASWERMWWGEEAQHFMDGVFLADRDVRELVTSRATVVNGPLAQFYRFIAEDTCCGPAQELGYTQPEPMVDPAAIPEALVPEDTATWMPVADRGPHAAGLLTMPVFLTKYGSRRARAHAAYNAFLCKDFVADTVKLTPSTEPDLTKRSGCSSCHQTLEPMAAYFTRVQESDWTWLPAATLPEDRCAKGKAGACKSYYDPAFGSLRGAYAAPSHVEGGPAALGAELAGAPEFAPCVVQNVASSLLGRALAPEDDAWKTQLTKVFVDGGYRMRALVRAIVTSPRYRAGNDDR